MTIVKGRLARELRDAKTRRLQREAEGERKNLIANLEAMNAELERFTYTAFHDLRILLVTIKGFLGALRHDLEANRQDQVQKDIQRIEGAADKMDELLSGLLELARIGRVIKASEEVDLGQLTQEGLQTLDVLIRSKEITVNVSPDFPTIYGDHILLRFAQENLIENAAKYPEGQEKRDFTVSMISAGAQIKWVSTEYLRTGRTSICLGCFPIDMAQGLQQLTARFKRNLVDTNKVA